MYRVVADGNTLHNDKLETLRISNAKLTLELGKTGLFEFTIYPDHLYYNDISVMLTMITVYRNSDIIFAGRVLNIKYGFFNEKQVTCEGELAFLLDSMIAPHTWSTDFSGYLSYIVGKHNEQVESTKQFTVGNITVADFTPFYVVENLEYKSALETLNTKMVQRSGGYLSVRRVNNVRYLDLLSYDVDASNVSTQTIRLGKNLLDISRETNSEDVFSCIIPLGAKQENSDIRIDVKSVNNGLPYIVNQTAAALYGRIYRQVIFDNITYEQTLYNTAVSYLDENYAGISTVEITAADLASIESGLDSFNVGQWVKVYDNKHFSSNPQTFLIRKMSIDLLNPAETKIVIGKTKKGITESIVGLSDSIKESSSSNSSSSTGTTTEQPYLIDSGTTGIWTWSKFSDGTCEFFGKIPITNEQTGSTFGDWYRSASLYEATTYAYPVQMTEAPAIEMMFQTRNANGALLWVFSQDAETAQSYLPQCYLIKPTQSTGIHGNINIIGRGKL